MPSQRIELPGNAQTHIWTWRLSVDEQTVATLEEALSQDEWERVRRFHFQADARRFVVRRGTVRQILAAYLAKRPQDIRFVYGPQGKPALAPDLPASLHFNLSDSGELAALAVATCHPVGIDIEQLRPFPGVDTLAAHVFTEAENEHINQASTAERSRLFFHFWTGKEAIAKAHGNGLAPTRPVFSASWRIHRLTLPAGYVGVLATQPEIKEIIYEFWPPEQASPARPIP